MKTFQWNLRKALALPLLICVCIISFFGGILSLKSQPNATAETTAATEYVNLAKGKTYTAPTYGNSYSASLTDGVASTDFNYGDLWYGMPYATESGLLGYGKLDGVTAVEGKNYLVGNITIDLTKTELFSKIRIHIYNLDDNNSCKGLLVSSSLDGETWEKLGNPAVKSNTEYHGAYWAELAVDTMPARYVRVQAMYDSAWCFLNEIEVLAAATIQEENIALNAKVEAPTGGASYTASLTDGVASDVFDYGANWYGLDWNDARSQAGHLFDANGNSVAYGRLGTMIIDLGEDTQISNVRIHLYNLEGQGIVSGLAVYTSTDKSTWTHQGNPTVKSDVNVAYWTEHAVSANARYVKVIMAYGTSWGFINEIEVVKETAVSAESCGDVIVGEIEAVSSNNLALGKTVYGLPDALGGNNTLLSTLTDGKTPGGWQYGINPGNNADLEIINGEKVNYLTLDLGAKKEWSSVKVHGYVESGSGINAPSAIYVAASNDTLSWTENKALTMSALDAGNCYWAGEADVLPTTTSRYVRIGIAGNGWTSIDEIEVYEAQEAAPIAPFTNNVASYATVTAATSSNADCYNGWDKLTDGVTHEAITYDNTTYGMNGSNINWVTFAFDKGITWNTVRIHYIKDGSAGVPTPKALYVAYSNNNEEYTEWTKLDTATSTASAWAVYTDKEVKSKYVRIGVELQGWGFIDEVEIFAKKPYVTYLMGCEKLALNAEVEAPTGGASYTASLTDGVASDVFDYGANWYGLDWNDARSQAGHLFDANGNSVAYGRLGTMIIDLGEDTQISNVRIHLYNLEGQGIVSGLAVYTSTDKSTWTHQGNPTVKSDVNVAYWTEHAVSANARYVKVVMAYNTSWGFINEIEVYGEHTLEEVAEKPSTLYLEGVKAHHACVCCGATYLYNESEDEYTSVTAESLLIERLTGFMGASMTLNNNLDFNFHASVGGEANSVQVVFTMEDKETVVDGVQNGAEYTFVLKKLGPQNIGQEIVARLLVDGVEKEVKTYSAHEYLYEVFKQSDEVGKHLIADIFEYGAAAQAYLGDTSTPVNTLYSDVAAYKTEFVAPTVTDKNVGVNATVDGYTFNAVNLKISSEVQMFFKFTAGANYKLIVNDVDVTDDVTTHADGSLVYYTNGISVVDFDEIYTARLYAGETLVQTVQYSVNSYVYSKHSSSNTKLATLVQRLYNYGLRAEAALPVDRTQERVNVAKGNSYTATTTPKSNAADNNNELTDGVTNADVYVAYAAGQELTFVLDFGEQKLDLAAFELHAMKGVYTENKTTFNGVFPSSVTVFISSDNSRWEKVGVAYATTKEQTTFNYQIELPYSVNAQFVKFVVAATGTASDCYLIDELCAFVYSDEIIEYSAYSEVEFSEVIGDVYASSKDSKDVNLISGKLAEISATGGTIVEVEYDSNGNIKNTPATSSLMTDGETLSTWENLTGVTASIHNSGKYFKFNGYSSRRIAYDLGYVCDVTSVTFRALRNDDEGVSVPNVDVLLSMDGITWYTFGTITYSSTTNKRVNAKTLTVNYTARFVAFEFDVENWVGIDELQVMGKKLSKASDSSCSRVDGGSLAVKNDAAKGIPVATESNAKNIYLAYHSYDTATHGGYGPIYQPEMEKVVAYHDADGNMVAPMFDGVLFLIDGALPNSTFGGAGASIELTASSLEWLKSSLLWGNDASLGAQNVKALNAAVQKMKNSGIVGNDYKVKVYFSLYYPAGVPSGQSFGTYTVGSESVSDISTAEGKLKLLQLWIQDMEANFGYTSNLEIGGYYWYMEHVDDGDQKAVVQGVANYLKTINRNFVWIPYFSAEGVSEWQTNGFDLAALQPNYAFDLKVQDSRLESAASIAKTYGTAIEIEMGHHVLTDARYRARYYEYLARAKELGYADAVHFYFFGVGVKGLLDDSMGVGRELYDYTYQFIAGNGELAKPAKNALISVEATKGSATEITIIERSKVTETTEILLREPPKYGNVTVNADGTVTYHADDTYTGVVTFTYVYSVAGVYSEVCTVTVNVA